MNTTEKQTNKRIDENIEEVEVCSGYKRYLVENDAEYRNKLLKTAKARLNAQNRKTRNAGKVRSGKVCRVKPLGAKRVY